MSGGTNPCAIHKSEPGDASRCACMSPAAEVLSHLDGVRPSASSNAQVHLQLYTAHLVHATVTARSLDSSSRFAWLRGASPDHSNSPDTRQLHVKPAMSKSTNANLVASSELRKPTREPQTLCQGQLVTPSVASFDSACRDSSYRDGCGAGRRGSLQHIDTGHIRGTRHL